jgi:hypothetical protein
LADMLSMRLGEDLPRCPVGGLLITVEQRCQARCMDAGPFCCQQPSTCLTSAADINSDGQGQTVTTQYDYRHWSVTCLTTTFATFMRMG